MNTSRFFRFLSALILLAMIFGLAVRPAEAQFPTPPKDQIETQAIGLNGAEGAIGLLTQRKGPIKVVVELVDSPTALVYASAGGGVNRNAVSQSKVQLNKIQLAQTAFSQAVKSANIPFKEIYRTQRVFNGVAMELDSQDVRAVAAFPGVKAIHPLVSKELDHTGSVPLVGALQAWANSTPYQGDGIDIGIIDTGIDYTHKNFGGVGTRAAYLANNPTIIEPSSFPTLKVVGGTDFAGNNYDASGKQGSSTPSPDPDPLDCGGHGSHVAGTAAGFGILRATGENPAPGAYAGYASITQTQYASLFKIGPGMAPKANLYALKVFGCSGSTDLTDQAIEWAVDPNQDGDLSDHLDVINMSLGSTFGSENDTSAIASNNAVLVGVIVVSSAGNNGDVYYSNGSPGIASLAISTAGSEDGSNVGDGFGVTQTPDAGILPAGTYGSSNSTTYNWSVTNSAVTGVVKYLGAGNSSGCQAFPVGSFTGKIALIDWTHTPTGTDECSSATRTGHAYSAGAIGVVMVYDLASFDIAIAGYYAIPATITTLATGGKLKAALASPGNALTPLTVKLSAEFAGTEISPYDPSLDDNVYKSSSRGPRGGDTGLKPDITAPGVTIFSTASGSGNQGVAFNGTSMASPHVAGAMAIMRQEHPTWTVQQLKALAMNTAVHDIYTSSSRTTLVNQDRIGAGRLDVIAAINTELIAYSTQKPGEVSLSYGFQEVVDTNPGGDDLTTDKNISIDNSSASAVQVNVSFDARYPTNDGVVYELLDAGNPLTNPVMIGAGASYTITVRQRIDANRLQRTRDNGISITDGSVNRTRDYLSQSGGYVVVAPLAGSEPVMRVPVYAAHRPASTRKAVSDTVKVGAADRAGLTIPMSGSTFEKTDDAALVYIHELLHESPDDPWSTGVSNNADLMAVGASSDFSLHAAPTNLDNVSLYIGLATQGNWTTPNEVEFDVFIDTNKDGLPDWVAFNGNTGLFYGGQYDTQVSVYCSYPDFKICSFKYGINGIYADTPFGGTKLNGNQFNSNVMTLVLPAGTLGFTQSLTDFYFYVDTYNLEYNGLVDTTPWIYYDLKKQAFETVDTTTTLMPLWKDSGNPSVIYDKTILYNQGGALGLLLNHHHNLGNKAEIIHLDPSYAALVWDKSKSFIRLPGQKVKLPIRVVNETNTSCTFDLTAVQTPSVWPVLFSHPQVSVPAHGSYSIDMTVTVPTNEVPGNEKNIEINARCQQDSTIAASNPLVVHVNYPQWLPLIGKN